MELEAKVTELEGSGGQATLALSTADYDSGWRTLSKGSMKKIRHKLGTKHLLVYIIGKEWEESGQFWYVHQKHYGGYWYYNHPPTSNGEVHSHPLMEYQFVGLWWWTDARNYIWVERGADDYDQWEGVRVYIGDSARQPQ